MEAKKNKDGSYTLFGAREPPKKIPVSLASGVFNVGRIDEIQLWLRCVGAEGAERENKGYEFLLRKNVCHGDIIEKKIIEHFSLTPGNKIEDDVFVGVPDVVGDNFIAEIKSTTQLENWLRNGIPQEYIYQALIYASMLCKKYAIITIYDLSLYEYENPENAKINPKKIKKIKYEITEKVKMKINEIREWYTKFVLAAISPVPKFQKDCQYLEAAFGCEKKEKNQEITEEEKEIAKKLIVEYDEFCEKKKKLEDLKSQLKEKVSSRAQIKTEVGIVDVIPGVESTVVDVQKLQKIYPEIYEKCRKKRKSNKSILVKVYK